MSGHICTCNTQGCRHRCSFTVMLLQLGADEVIARGSPHLGNERCRGQSLMMTQYQSSA